MMTICIDPGHGMGNRRRGIFDPGACAGGLREADIAMDWANTLRDALQSLGHRVVRTRVNNEDPAPVSRRDDIAISYRCDRMISLHCNATNGRANGTETFYRGADDRAMALRLTAAVCGALDTVSRGAKTEQESQHTSLAVLDFDKCWLVELGFIDHSGDRAKLVHPKLRQRACEALAIVLTTP